MLNYQPLKIFFENFKIHDGGGRHTEKLKNRHIVQLSDIPNSCLRMYHVR